MDWYFGKEKAEEFGYSVRKSLGGRIVTKNKELAEEKGGLIYEADKLNMSMWDLLETIEGLCYQGKAMELDDTRYYIIPIEYRFTVYDRDGNWELRTTNPEKVTGWLLADKGVDSFEKEEVE